jgi:hypothetical protein
LEIISSRGGRDVNVNGDKRKQRNIPKRTICIQLERIVLLDFIHRLVSQKIEELKTYSV